MILFLALKVEFLYHHKQKKQIYNFCCNFFIRKLRQSIYYFHMNLVNFSQQITVSYAANLWWNWKLCIFIVLINFCHKVSLKRAWGTSSKSTNEAVILSWPTLFRNCALIFRKLVWKLKRERERVCPVCGLWGIPFPFSAQSFCLLYTHKQSH